MKRHDEIVEDVRVMTFTLIFLSYCAYWCFFGSFTVDYLVRHFGSVGTVGAVSFSILCMMVLYYFLQPTLVSDNE